MIPFFIELNFFFFLIRSGYILIYVAVIFPIQSPEFIKSRNFGSNLKNKTTQKNPKMFQKLIFIGKKIYFSIEIVYILIDLS